eukprot:1145401-Pelagomonas_calceolata.AAC.2
MKCGGIESGNLSYKTALLYARRGGVDLKALAGPNLCYLTEKQVWAGHSAQTPANLKVPFGTKIECLKVK